MEKREEQQEQLEEMSGFFEARLDMYDEHMMTDMIDAKEVYTFTAQALPVKEGCKLLDLGCGTGLELEFYFPLCPTAQVTGIDLSQGMLSRLGEKFPGKDLTLIQGSYFQVPFGENVFDAAVSVESLHHFTKEEKIPLYAKVRAALKEGGYFLLTDYFSLSEEEERRCRETLLALKKAQGLGDDQFYHYDTPLTVGHEVEALQAAGFSRVEIVNQWGPTYAIRAVK